MGLRFIGFMVVAMLVAAGIAWVVNNVRIGESGGEDKEERK